MAATLGNGNITFGDSTTQSTAALPLTGGTLTGALSGTSISTTGNVTVGGTFAANGGVTLGDAAADALTITSNTATVNNTLTLAHNAASTNTVVDVLTLRRTSSGTPANGIGVGLAFQVETTAGNETAATIDAVATDVTSASEDFDLVFSTMAGGAAASEALRIKSDNNVTTPGTLVMGSHFSHRNKIINGAMNVSQRGTSWTAAPNGTVIADRFVKGSTTTAVVNAVNDNDAPANSEFKKCIKVTVTTADTSIAADDYFQITTKLEGYNIVPLVGKTFTLSFWVKSSRTGIHCVAFRNSGVATIPDRSYVVEYTVNTANTWEKKVITINDGLTSAGTWDYTNGFGLTIGWYLAVGTTYQTTANAWQTGNFVGTSNQVNCLATVGNVFALTGVQLELGSTATPFESKDYLTELLQCRRFFQSGWLTVTGDGAITYLRASSALVPPMRANPSFTVYDNAGNPGKVSADASNNISAIIYGGSTYLVVTVNNILLSLNVFMNATWTASCE